VADATCTTCAAVFTARAITQRFCSDRCAREFYNSPANATCTDADCDRPLRARGLCAMHWKREHAGPRSQIEVPCEMCGEVVVKDASTTRARRYCSYACRSAHRAAVGSSYQRLPPAQPKPERQLEIRYDQRSSLRAAYEDQDWPAVIRAVKTDVEIRDNGCWEWTRALSEGYARAQFGNRTIAVHRIVVEAKHRRLLGAQPVHHMRANRKCVNPDHLVPVTHRENIAEMLSRTYLVGRIRDLEAALMQVDPDHHLLSLVDIESTA
jgi:endogenous inhibitor of DNA gyrase (YacG/DUF329 family)